jgi:hypothetical protein
MISFLFCARHQFRKISLVIEIAGFKCGLLCTTPSLYSLGATIAFFIASILLALYPWQACRMGGIFY